MRDIKFVPDGKQLLLGWKLGTTQEVGAAWDAEYSGTSLLFLSRAFHGIDHVLLNGAGWEKITILSCPVPYIQQFDPVLSRPVPVSQSRSQDSKNKF